MTIEQFERQLMTALLAGDDPVLDVLRAQYDVATIRAREITDRGFVTTFDVSSSEPAVADELLHLDDLQVQLDRTNTPADCSLHVHNGYLRSLECFLYDGVLPESPEIVAAWYYGTERFPGITPELLASRDIEELLDHDDE